MRPDPFKPEPLSHDERFARDAQTGLVWHRTFSRPLYADTDRSRVVYHANYLRFFELGRATLMRDLSFPYAEVEANGFVYPITRLELSFHVPLQYDEPMWIHTRPRPLERVRVTFDYVIIHGETGAIVCKGYTTHCALRGETGRPTAVDPHTLKMWERFPK